MTSNTSKTQRAAGFSVLALVLLPSLALAQAPLHTFDGDAAGDRLGTSVRNAGDVNGDGLDDVIVGAPSADPNGPSSGSASVYSGVDGALLWTFDGAAADDRFGTSVSGAGDVNGDGYDEVIVGAPRADTGGPDAGCAYVFSGQDGTLLFTFCGSAWTDDFGFLNGDRLGESVAAAGDVNADGHDDVIVGAPHSFGGSTAEFAGSAYVYSGRDGAVLRTFHGVEFLDYFGQSVDGAGDTDGDGFDDVVVCNIGSSAPAAAKVYSGANGAVLHIMLQNASDPHSVAGAGDVNGDGFSDILVGAPYDVPHGKARVYSGIDASLLHSFDGDAGGDQFFGDSVRGAGDVDGDGFDDLIVGAPQANFNGSNSGAVYVYSGSDGAELLSITGDAALDMLGTSVSGAGDVNGDGLDDLLVGIPGSDTNGTDSGSARIYSLTPVASPRLFSFETVGGVPIASASVGGAGDVNGDGFDDLIVGVPLDDPSGLTSDGSAFVLSGANGSLLYWYSGGWDYKLGWSVSGAGDVNADGFDDFIIGEKDAFTGFNGRAVVRSGLDGSTLHSFTGSFLDELGTSVSAAGDVNGDGYDDVIVGAPKDEPDSAGFTTNWGRAFVFSGLDGSELYAFTGTAAGDGLGASVSGAGDVNGDGFDDVIVGAYSEDVSGVFNAGRAYVYSGLDGSVLHSFAGTSLNENLGFSVSGAGDVNGDGLDDVIVGAFGADPNGIQDAGAAYVYSGLDGSVLHSFTGLTSSQALGFSVSGAGDVNGDGNDDVIVQSSGDGEARVYSGLDGSVLATKPCETGFFYLRTVSGAGDVNGDGLDDVIISAGNSADVWSITPGADAGRAVPYGRSCGANGRLPRMSASGNARIGDTLTLELRGAAPNAVTYIVFGLPADTMAPLDPLGVPLDVLGLTGCSLHSSAFFSLPLTTDALGQASFSMTIPNDPEQANSGTVFMHQWITLDLGVTVTPPANLPLTFSDGLMIDIGL